MIPITKTLKLSRRQYYEVHLSIINGLLPVKMTPKEIEVLSCFMSFTGELGLNRFGTTARKMVKQDLGLSDGGLGNYLKFLREKGFLKQSGTEWTINPILIPDGSLQEYRFLLINGDTSEEEDAPASTKRNGKKVASYADQI